jgi:RNA polymerase sigma-70 factor (family 1)
MTSLYADEIELMTAFYAGKRDAENSIFREFFRPMCYIAYNITNQMPAAEDIVAEAFIRLFNRRTEFAGLQNISAFLYVSVRNAALTHNTTQTRHSAAYQQIAAASDTAENNAELQQLQLLEANLLHAIYQEIENLPGKCRDIFKLIYIENRSTQEIAEQLNINPQTVRTQKARAIQLIKTELLKKKQLATLAALLLLETTSK